MPLINVHDLAQLLDRQGYYVDDDDGEVAISLNDTENVDNLLIILAVLGALQVKNKTLENELGFYLPHWKCYNNLESYCEDFPNYPACKCYDL